MFGAGALVGPRIGLALAAEARLAKAAAINIGFFMVSLLMVLPFWWSRHIASSEA
jgi:hypothetical protein